MSAIAKYTTAGIEARRDALAGGTALALATFKVSSTEIDLSGENNVTDLVDSWITEPITSYRTIDNNRLEFKLLIPSEKATAEARSFAIYLEDGTPFIVGVPANFYNANIAQEFLVQVEFINSDAGEFSFVHIEPNYEQYIEDRIGTTAQMVERLGATYTAVAGTNNDGTIEEFQATLNEGS